MPISSTSTLEELEAAYLDNSDYATDGSIAKAKEFAKACRGLLLRMPKQSQEREGGVTMNVEAIEKSLDDVNAWLNLHGATLPTDSNGNNAVRLHSFQNFRD